MKIYAIKYIPEDKIIYIGQTIQAGKKRFYDHFRNAQSLEKTDAFHKFLYNKNIKDFEFIVLEDNIDSKEELNIKEAQYIKQYDTVNCGFNSYTQSNTINLHPIIKKVKWFDNNRNYICTFDSIVAAEQGTGVNCSNISHCCNHIQTKTSKGWFRFEDDDSELEDSYRVGTSLKVDKLDPFTFEVIKTYDSLQKAEKEEGLIKGYLSFVCNGSKYSAKGFLYQYHDETLRRPYSGGQRVKTGIAQVDKETHHVLHKFLTCEDCANILGFNQSTITRARNSYPKPSLGFLWVRADKYKELLDKGEIIEDEFTKVHY